MTTHIACVIPTCRPDSLNQWLAKWISYRWWDELFIVEDQPNKMAFTDGIECQHVSWREMYEDLRDNSGIISRRDSAIRSYGFILAARSGATHIVTIDDDCFPQTPFENLGKEHIDSMTAHPRWVTTVPGMHVRGFPYENRGVLSEVHVSCGLWCGVPDVDGVQALTTHQATFEPPPGRWLLPKGQYASLCGMNLAFTREVAPAFYFAPMGHGQPFRRFDDIWGGLVAKRICDHLGYAVSVGEPWVYHSRASCKFANLIKEAPGIHANEYVWELVHGSTLIGTNAAECAIEMGWHLQNAKGVKGCDDGYLSKWGESLEVWGELWLKL